MQPQTLYQDEGLLLCGVVISARGLRPIDAGYVLYTADIDAGWPSHRTPDDVGATVHIRGGVSGIP